MTHKLAYILAPNYHPTLVVQLQDAGLKVILASDNNKPLTDITVLIIHSQLVVNDAFLAQFPNLRIIGLIASGTDNITLHDLEKRNITLLTVPEGNALSVAEHCLALTLSLLRQIPKNNYNLAQGIWDRIRGQELSGKTVGIIGYGHVGSTFATLLAPFHVTVLAHDLYKKGFQKNYIHEASLADIQANADIVSLHLPLNKTTAYYAHTDFFSRLIKKPLFINTSRGKIVKMATLLDALNKNLISGAGIDVYEHEPPTNLSEQSYQDHYRLTHHPQIICTAHVAGVTNESFFRLSDLLAKKVIGLLG
ncbi:MAG: NAD(P)-dependent oxidoreductase [Phycisphaerales bacterium]|nr:NAD(P)-dependent oxidoreductase [Phycisphaerales bacterium]